MTTFADAASNDSFTWGTTVVYTPSDDNLPNMAVGIPDDLLGERIHMLIVPNPLNQISVSEIKTYLTARLEKYKIPDVFYFDVALPIGRTGKADRGQFKSQILSGSSNLVPQSIS
jgi:non-ribosomal peptide synthetase component E (peptide arylation enzyme)